MENIQKIDKNFVTACSIRDSGVIVDNVCDAPFKIYGLIKPEGAEGGLEECQRTSRKVSA